jgi:hypothetical protein
MSAKRLSYGSLPAFRLSAIQAVVCLATVAA